MKNNIKTIAIVSPFFSPNSGGVQRYVYEIAKRLSRIYKWRIVIITSGEYFSKDEKIEENGFTIYKLSYTIKISNSPLSFSWFKKIHKIFIQEKPDIINIQSPVPGIGNIAAIVAGKIPLVVTYHSGSMRKGKILFDIPIWIYEHFFMHLFLIKAKKIISASDVVRNVFLKRYRYKNTTITPGADTKIFKARQKEKNNKPSILFVASLSKAEQYKGLQTLIEITNRLRYKLPNVSLSVVGEGDMRTDYEERVKKMKLQDVIYFKGKLSGKDLIKEYQKASVLVLPTKNDNIPTVIIEAMSCGLPVIAYKVGAIPLLIENEKTGFLVEVDDIDILTDRIYLLLNNKKLALKFGLAARLKAKNDYDWRLKANETNRLFNDLLNIDNKKTIEVVHVTAYYPPHLGGAEQRIKELVTNLAKNEINVTVLTSNSGAPTGSFVQDGVKVYYLRSFEFAHTPIALSIFWNLLRIKKPTIIHLHIAQAFFPEIVAAIAKVRRIPYIAHVRCLICPSGKFGVLLPFYNQHILGKVYRGARKIIVLTPDYKEIIHKEFDVPLNRIVVIPNATTFNIDKIYRNNFHKPIRLLAVGRVGIQKNYFFMLKVMKLLKDKYQLDFKLKIVGPGEGIKALEDEVKNIGIKDNVLFTGEMGRDKLEEIYEESDILIHTSLIEGFSTVLIEAMAKGLPIIASNVIGTRSVIKDKYNGFLVDLNVEKMSRTVMKIVNDKKLYANISKNNLDDIQKYKWKKITEQTLNVYKNEGN